MFGDFNERISAIDIISKYYSLQIFVTKYKKKYYKIERSMTFLRTSLKMQINRRVKE